MKRCSRCGNEVACHASTCKFCHQALQRPPESGAPSRQLHRIVNLKYGRPTVATALRKLEQEIQQARRQRLSVATLIHGYGSSGKGGLIKQECRKMLAYFQQTGRIKSYIAGEQFKRKSGPGKALLKQYRTLASLCVSDFNNPGVSIVVL